MIKNVISVIDGAAGSCGKAKVIGEIATDKSINLGAAISNCMPNAGHTFVARNGKKIVFTNIPVSVVNPTTELFIGPGSVIDMETFITEYENVKDILGKRKIYIHELVPLVEKRHKQYEMEHIKSGSTFKGCGAVIKEKVMRDEKLKFFKNFENAKVCENDDWLDKLYIHLDNPNEYVILEGAQGCDLSLNHSGNYPYVTSRNVSTTQLLADSGISAERLLETIMVIRPFPIRISNITKSGDYIYTGGYGSGLPLTWSQVNLSAIFGSYPCIGDIECFDYTLNMRYIQRLLYHSTELTLKQLFGKSYALKKEQDISVLEALELERLFYKTRGEKRYQSKIINLQNNCYMDNDVSYIEDLSEETTVTKMERRIFDLDICKLKNNCKINTPYGIYLNFFQHLDLEYRNKSGDYNNYYFNRYIREYISWLESQTKTDILALGTGAINGDCILKKNLIKR